MRILHLISDPGSVARLSSACNGMRGFDNAYVLLWPSLYHAPECAKTKGRVKVVVPGSAEYRALLRAPADVIWVHGAYQQAIRFVLAYKGEARIAWSALGQDYAGYIETAKRGVGLKPRIAGLFARYKLSWILPSEHLRFFRRVDYFSIRDKRDRDALRRMLPATVRQVPFFYDSVKVNEHEAAFVARTLDPWAGVKALGGTGTIRFDANGGTGAMPEVYCEGAAVPHLPANMFARDGYMFAGWSLFRKGAVMWGDRASASGMPFVNGAVKLYARWSGFRCVVRFHANGGVGEMPEFSFLYGIPTSLPNNSFVKAGLFFKGWSQTENGKVVWKDGAPISEPLATNETVDLFAIWTQELPPGAKLPVGFYGIRFHCNDGTGRSVVYGFDHESLLRTPRLSEMGWESPNYEFLGWSQSFAGEKIAYHDGATTFAPVAPGEIMNLYAIRRPMSDQVNLPSVKINFNVNRGSGEMAPLEVKAWKPAKLPRCQYERRFFTFGGWSLSPQGEALWKDEDEITMPPMRGGTIVLYARWIGFECTVVFDKNLGMGKMPDFRFTFGELAKLPKCTFRRPLHVFAGWATTPLGPVNWEDEGLVREPPCRDFKTTLYAKWKGERVTVRFDPNGGIGTMSELTFNVDGRVNLPVCAFTKKNRRCAGWAFSPHGAIAIRDGGIAEDIPFKHHSATLYAVWVATKAGDDHKESGHAGAFGPKNPMRILHIVSGKLFVGGIIRTFDSIPSIDNHYILITTISPFDTSGIKGREKLEIVNPKSDRYHELLKSNEFDVVWLHGASMYQVQFTNACSSKPIIVWSVFGFDYVDYDSRWLMGPRTTFQWWKGEPFIAKFKRLVLWGMSCLGVSRLSRSQHGRFFRRIDFFSCVLKEEEPLLRKLLNRDAKNIYFSYILKFTNYAKPPKLVNLDHKMVWVGNSATLANNYWDIFPLIAQSKEYGVVSPLVYGTDGWNRGPYAEPIEKCAYRYFGDKFTAITHFLPFDEYAKLIEGCAAFVFGHRRQQAVGNILMAIRRGGCVFLDARSPVYKFCLRRGFKVYTLDDLKLGISKVVEDFKPYQKKNAKIANTTMSVQETLAKIHKSVRQVQGECERRRSQNG